MRSRASGVARLQANAAPICVISRTIVRFVIVNGRATPDARERIPTTPRAL